MSDAQTSVLVGTGVFLCGYCDQFTVMTYDASKYKGAVRCGHCGRKEAEECSDLAHAVCATSWCADFLDHGGSKHDKGKCATCNKPLVDLCDVWEELPDYPEPTTDDSVPRPVRQLKALTQRIESWIASSGAHHRSTSGSHGSGATEQHSKAHTAKAQLRDRWPDEVDALIKQVDAKTWGTVVTRAKQAKAALGNK